MKVYYGSELIDVDMKNVAGNGAEGTVVFYDFRGRLLALKFYLNIAYNDVRYKKVGGILRKQLPPLPGAIPVELLKDDKNKHYVGIAMDGIDKKAHTELIWWTNLQYRANVNLNHDRIVKVFMNIRNGLLEFHKQGFVIGDFNQGGVMVNNQSDEILFLDIDSFQFDEFPSLAYTMEFVDPRIYPRIIAGELGRKKIHDEQSDIYSYTAMLMKCLTLAGPFSGVNDVYDAPSDRVRLNLTVLHGTPSTPYPSGAIPFDQIHPGIAQYIRSVIVDGNRKMIELSVLHDALGMSIPVQINQVAPRKDLQAAANQQRQVAELLSGLLRTLAYDVGPTYVQILGYDAQKNLNYYYIDTTVAVNGISAKIEKRTIAMDFHRVRFIGNHQLMVFDAEGNITTYDLRTNQNYNYHTDLGLDSRPIVGGGAGQVYTANGPSKWLLMQKGQQTTRVRLYSPGNTRLFSDVQTGHALGYNVTVYEDRMPDGTPYVNSRFTYFFIRDTKTFDVKLSDFEVGEYLQDMAVMFTSGTALIVRQTKYQGQIRTRLDEISLVLEAIDNRVMVSRIVDGEMYTPVDGAAYVRNQLLYATDKGIVVEKLLEGTRRLFPSTAGVVFNGTTLKLHQNGVVAINGSRIDFITV